MKGVKTFVLLNEKYSQNWHSYVMIKFLIKMFMIIIIIELKQKLSYLNIIVLFL